MALKTFNLDNKIYEEFSAYCKKHGISMSKRIENFIRSELEKIKGKITLSTSSSKLEHSFKKYC